MTEVLGYRLQDAIRLLQDEGLAVKTAECRSKKGLPNETDARVIRQAAQADGSVLLTYAVFKTACDETNA